MNNILVISGHGNLSLSTANNTILETIESHLPQAEVRRLSTLYPNGDINVAIEQEAIRRADTIVLQFPLNWYQTPHLLKKWMDEVLAYGFAYGTGAVMAGKKLAISYTAAAPDMCYQGNEAFIQQEHIVDVFRATARMCAMDFVGAIVENGYAPNPTGDAEICAAQQAKAKAQAERLFALLGC